MATPIRLVPLSRQFEFAQQRLLDRMTGPVFDSGNGQPIEVPAMSDDEYLWEPAPPMLDSPTSRGRTGTGSHDARWCRSMQTRFRRLPAS